MKILVETPTWLGDSVMATPMLQNLRKLYPNSEISLIGSPVSIQILQGFADRYFILQREKNRFKEILEISKSIGKVDIAFSLRTSIYSGLLQLLTAKQRVGISKTSNRFFLTDKIFPKNGIHQVEKYLSLLENSKESDLHLYFSPKKFSKETLGINAGATYGSAKRWYPERFAKVIENLSSRYETILFGGKGEIDINRDIENILKERRVSNFTNLAGKTSIQELAENIGGLSLFITNDSGPMHIAGAYKIPTITIFGSTNHTETDQWKNEKSFIVRKEMECSPCMKRECPLKHHNCMKEIYPEDILKVISEFKL